MPSSSTWSIRSVRLDDSAQLVNVHASSFGHRDNSRRQVVDFYSRTIERVLGDQRPGAPSDQSKVIVSDGEVVGLVVGVAVPVTFKGRNEWGILGALLQVVPDRVPSEAVREMLYAFRDGPQLFTWGDRVNEGGRKAVVRAGFQDYGQHSMRWGRVIQPGSGAASALLNRKALPWAIQRKTLRVAASGIDALSRRHLKKETAVRPPRATLQRRELRNDDVVEYGPKLVADYSLTPRFGDLETVAYQWETLRTQRSDGTMHRVAVVTPDGELVGWYILHQSPTGTAEVVQLVADPSAAHDMVAIVLGHASELGAGSVHGHVRTDLILPLGAAGAHFYVNNSNLVVWSENPEVHEAFRDSKVFLSGLEGEYAAMLARSPNDP